MENPGRCLVGIYGCGHEANQKSRGKSEHYHEIPAFHPQLLDPRLAWIMALTEPLPKGWTNGDFPPTAADFRMIHDGPPSTHSGPSAAPEAMPVNASLQPGVRVAAAAFKRSVGRLR